MKSKQKGFGPIPLIIAISVAVILIVFFLSARKNGLPTPEKNGNQQTTQNVPAIKSSSDLNTVASDLDNTDMSQFDKELNQLDADASTF